MAILRAVSFERRVEEYPAQLAQTIEITVELHKHGAHTVNICLAVGEFLSSTGVYRNVAYSSLIGVIWAVTILALERIYEVILCLKVEWLNYNNVAMLILEKMRKRLLNS